MSLKIADNSSLMDAEKLTNVRDIVRYLGMTKVMKASLIVVSMIIVIVAFMAFNLFKYKCKSYDTETKVYLEAFLGMDCNLRSSY